MEQDMAGTFQVLWGNEDGTFSAAETLNGTDDQPLILPGSGNDTMTDRICTRPTAADIDGDGNLDIVTGNFTGTFYIFRGAGAGKFAPEATIIMAGEEPLRVQAHSDPFLVDWDSDGDLDIVSGSSAGGVYVSTNEGSKTEPKFGAASELVAPAGHNYDSTRLGDKHMTGPQSATRVWVDDVNEDGKLDLLVGDSVRLMFPAEGLSDEEALAKMEAWNEKQKEVMEWWMEVSKDIDHEAIMELKTRQAQAANQEDEGEDDDEDDAEVEDEDEGGDDDKEDEDQEDEGELTKEELAMLEAYDKSMNEYRERSTELQRERKEFVRDEMTGFVWVFYQE
jgi:hypothetical protein